MSDLHEQEQFEKESAFDILQFVTVCEKCDSEESSGQIYPRNLEHNNSLFKKLLNGVFKGAFEIGL